LKSALRLSDQGAPSAGRFSNAFFGLAVMTAGIVPLCVAVGLIADWPGLVLWAQGAATSKGWLIFFGLSMFAFAGLIQLWGWRALLRIQNTLIDAIESGRI